MFFDKEADKFRDACGVFGYFSTKKEKRPIGQYAYYSLNSLQHRGQDSAGIYVSNEGVIKGKRDVGLVSYVFNNEKKLKKFQGNIGIGHVRYATSGGNGVMNAQPITGKTRYGTLAIAHNGHFLNNETLRKKLTEGGTIFQTGSDTELVLNLVAKSKKRTLKEAIIESLKKIKGSYSLIIMSKDQLFILRDPHGIRPLVYGKIENDHVFVSETCALASIGAEFVRDVKPGEIISIDHSKLESEQMFDSAARVAHCSFEYIYFARNDSTLDGNSVYKSRIRLGVELGKESPVEADIVIGVPDSGITSAIGYSEKTGILFGEGFVKNKYVGRTFITPTAALREKSVQVKLNPLRATIEDKKVVVIDDSIVRGTTSRKLTRLLKEAGAKEVHFRISSPKIINSCFFGINTPSKEELIANSMTTEEMRDFIEADSLSYLSLEGMLHAIRGETSNRCFGCFKKEGYPFKINGVS